LGIFLANRLFQLATPNCFDIHDGGDDEVMVLLVNIICVALHAMVEGHHHLAGYQNKWQYQQRDCCNLPTEHKRYCKSSY
jgi:hypothetical protein